MEILKLDEDAARRFRDAENDQFYYTCLREAHEHMKRTKAPDSAAARITMAMRVSGIMVQQYAPDILPKDLDFDELFDALQADQRFSMMAEKAVEEATDALIKSRRRPDSDDDATGGAKTVATDTTFDNVLLGSRIATRAIEAALTNSKCPSFVVPLLAWFVLYAQKVAARRREAGSWLAALRPTNAFDVAQELLPLLMLFANAYYLAIVESNLPFGDALYDTWVKEKSYLVGLSAQEDEWLLRHPSSMELVKAIASLGFYSSRGWSDRMYQEEFLGHPARFTTFEIRYKISKLAGNPDQLGTANWEVYDRFGYLVSYIAPVQFDGNEETAKQIAELDAFIEQVRNNRGTYERLSQYPLMLRILALLFATVFDERSMDAMESYWRDDAYDGNRFTAGIQNTFSELEELPSNNLPEQNRVTNLGRDLVDLSLGTNLRLREQRMIESDMANLINIRQQLVRDARPPNVRNQRKRLDTIAGNVRRLTTKVKFDAPCIAPSANVVEHVFRGRA